MDISSILTALAGHTVSPDAVSHAALQLLPFAPLLPALVLTLLAVSPNRRRRARPATVQATIPATMASVRAPLASGR